MSLRGGSNQARVRDHNERLVLSLIRRNGSLSKAQIARIAGFSAQTATVIMRSLEQEQLLVRDKPVRGKVGQPSVPMRLNPDGVFSLGLKVGRRSADLVLMDFVGSITERRRIAYSFPGTEQVVDFVTRGARELGGTLPPEHRSRLSGLGIAMPFEIWKWGEQVGAPEGKMRAWEGFDLKGAIFRATGLETFLENDATAGCSAELLLGNGHGSENFCYFHVGFFIGGGIVLNHHVITGPTGNAGSFGAMPMAGDKPGTVSLIDRASIHVLANLMQENGQNPEILWQRPDDWGDPGPVLDSWITLVGDSLATAIVATCSVIDFTEIIIDGGMPESVRARIVQSTRSHLEAMDVTGIAKPLIREGSIGPNAPAMGGAILPIATRYFINPTAIYN
ncbi:MAG TPA: ROK family transcriptional regulator [Devosia sp.]|nr:ROK family transcriptional regulator [Devosia sp.]